MLFVTDLHGSTLVFRKALAAARQYDVDLMVLGGDVSGKRMLPVVPIDERSFAIYEPYKMRDETGDALIVAREREIEAGDINAALQRLENKGYYWHRCSAEEIEALNSDEKSLRSLIHQRMRERLLSWGALAATALSDIPCFWTGGNDDEEEVLRDVSAASPTAFQYVEDRAVTIAGFNMISVGYSNITPFNTARELSEEALGAHLLDVSSQLRSVENVILNVHVPPFGCGTLDVVSSPRRGSVLHVGSRAVRTFIERHQPLAALVGHIHEGRGVARIGDTEVFNPGSDYTAGVMNAFVISLNPLRGRSEFVHIVS
jgi:Icc-related predicted phosphoesterase